MADASQRDDGSQEKTIEYRLNGIHVRCPHCRNAVEVIEQDSLTREVSCASCGSTFRLIDQEDARRIHEPRKIAQFELLQPLGTGAFGSVWKARDLELDRIVAIKIPRNGQLTPDEQTRFLREAQAAAQLKHPNIVSVHEVGRQSDTIYIVSDFINGANLAESLQSVRPSPNEAAMLCIKLCDALQHAHEAKVIHRDLKPANVMLDTAGEPYVMDFGLAKRDAGEITMTMDGVILGTPAYMAPEQARGELQSVDHRSDIYSLGVILFQLLTGECPFRGNVRMLLNQVLEDEPPSPRKLNAAVPQDLETICLKCLAKIPARRYPTAGELSRDLRRWLDREPIHARPPSAFYRAKLFAQRNKLLVASTSLITLILLVASIVSSVLYVKTLTAQQATQAELVASEDLAEFLTRDLLNAADPSVAKGRKVSVEEVLRNAEATLQGRFPDRPVVEARIRNALAMTYLSLGHKEKARSHAETASEILSLKLGEESPQTIVARTTLAKVYAEFPDRYDEAERLIDALIALHMQRDGESAPSTLKLRFDRAHLFMNRKQWSAVEQECREVLAIQKSALGPAHVDTIETALTLANALEAMSSSDGYRSDEASRILADQYEIAKATFGVSHPISLRLAFDIAEQSIFRNQQELALQTAAKSLPLAEQTWGEAHPRTLAFLNLQATVLSRLHRDEESAVILAKILDRSRRAHGSNNAWAIDASILLAASYSNRRMFAKSLDLLEEALRATRLLNGEDSKRAMSIRKDMGFQLNALNRFDEAIDIYEELLTEIEDTSRGADTAFIKGDYGTALRRRNGPGDLELAETVQREGLQEAIAAEGESSYNVVLLRYQSLAPTLFYLEKYREAEEQYRLAQKVCLERIDDSSRYAWILCDITESLAVTLTQRERFLEAKNEISRTKAFLEYKGILTAGASRLLHHGKNEFDSAIERITLHLPFEAAEAVASQSLWSDQYSAEKEIKTSVGMTMQLIPPGKFEYTRAANSSVPASEPIQVSLSTAFYLSTTEVTVDQFRKFIDGSSYVTDAERAGGSNRYDQTRKQIVLVAGTSWREPGFTQGSAHPVVCVSWNDAKEFCRWLSEQEGRPFYLPTEAEWEWAARAGSKEDYFFGSDVNDLADHAICGRSGHSKTADVATKHANAWGLHGVLGNVVEWMEDDASGYVGNALVDPIHLSRGKQGVVRGGASGYDDRSCVISTRRYWPRDHSTSKIGFRVATPVDWKNSQETLLQDAKSEAKQRQRVASQQLGIPINHENSLKMRFRLIPAGSCMIGSHETEIGHRDDETPFRVTLTRSFYLGETEVTVAQFRAFIDGSGYKTYAETDSASVFRNAKEMTGLNWKSPGFEQSDEHPVVMLRRPDCDAFCAWLSKREGAVYRLPTEAEWEYACRAGTQAAHYFARRENLSDYAQIGGVPDQAPRAVRLLKPNAWGLHDMYGNLSEWTADWYGEYPHGAASDPRGIATGQKAVVRGGSWMSHLSWLRSAARKATHSKLQSDDIGFRVLLEVSESPSN